MSNSLRSNKRLIKIFKLFLYSSLYIKLTNAVNKKDFLRLQDLITPKNRGILDAHRGYKEIPGNILAVILSLVVFYPVVVAINNRLRNTNKNYVLFQTKTGRILDDIQTIERKLNRVN